MLEPAFREPARLLCAGWGALTPAPRCTPLDASAGLGPGHQARPPRPSASAGEFASAPGAVARSQFLLALAPGVASASAVPYAAVRHLLDALDGAAAPALLFSHVMR